MREGFGPYDGGGSRSTIREILAAEERILKAMDNCKIYSGTDVDRQRIAVARVKIELLEEGDDDE